MLHLSDRKKGRKSDLFKSIRINHQNKSNSQDLTIWSLQVMKSNYFFNADLHPIDEVNLIRNLTSSLNPQYILDKKFK